MTRVQGFESTKDTTAPAPMADIASTPHHADRKGYAPPTKVVTVSTEDICRANVTPAEVGFSRVSWSAKIQQILSKNPVGPFTHDTRGVETR